MKISKVDPLKYIESDLPVGQFLGTDPTLLPTDRTRPDPLTDGLFLTFLITKT